MKIHRKYYLPQKAVVIVISLATSQASSSSQLRISIKAAQKPLRMLQAMTKVCGRLTKKFKKKYLLCTLLNLNISLSIPMSVTTSNIKPIE